MLSNPLLRSEVELDARLNSFMMDEGLIDLMTKINSVTRREKSGGGVMNCMLIAASLLCLLVVGGLLYLHFSYMAESRLPVVQGTHEPERKLKDEAAKKEGPPEFQHPGYIAASPHHTIKHQILQASRFDKVAAFELLIGSVTRSEQFRLISPVLTDTITSGKEVVFEWMYEDKTEPLSIILMNNRGVRVCEIPLGVGKNNLLEGLYYWKIVAGDDMILMGKLTVFQNIKF
jgi:hypothetical protein